MPGSSTLPCPLVNGHTGTATAKYGSQVHPHQQSEHYPSRRSVVDPHAYEANIPLLHETPDHAQRVVQTALALLENEAVATHGEHTDSTPPVLHTGDTDDLRPRVSRLLNEIRVAELVFRERFDVRDGLAPETLRQEFNLVTLNVLHDEDIEALEEGERDVVDGIAKDRFLNEENIAVRLLDLLTHVQQVLPALLDDLVHLPIVVNHDSVVHLRITRQMKILSMRQVHIRQVWVRSTGTG